MTPGVYREGSEKDSSRSLNLCPTSLFRTSLQAAALSHARIVGQVANIRGPKLSAAAFVELATRDAGGFTRLGTGA